MLALAHTAPASLEDIHADVWHAHALGQSTLPVRSTGDVALDSQLPGGGWPVGAMTEILQSKGVHNEWRLLLPALAHCATVVLVGAPHVPFAPALAAQGLRTQQLLWVQALAPAQSLWATEQALRCADVDAVLAWLPHTGKAAARTDQLRRLQMAAAGHSKLLFVMRPASAQTEASPAVLRLLVDAQSNGAASGVLSDALQVRVIKRKGPPLTESLRLRARNARISLLLAASQSHALDRTAACA
jgi:protein ImuA